MRPQLPAVLYLLLSSIAGCVASSLAIFEDASCKKSSSTITGEDGYPDGVCTNIRDVAEAPYQSFMFITLDDGCTPTIYQNNTTSDTCSGAAYVAYISRCYNTSWAYYSIDECTPVTSGSSTSTSSTSASTSTKSSADNSMSGGAMAGAIVGSVCGLGIIAAVCLYLFWFRPRQKEKEKKEKGDAENKAAAEAEAKKRKEVSKAELTKPHELQQQPPELQSPDGIMELPIEGIFEAPGDRGGVEVDNDAQLPVELPGDHMYWSSNSSSGTSDEAQRYQR